MLQPATSENFDVEAALNACLLELCSCQLDTSPDAEFVVTLIDFPQCRGEGDTIDEALQRARYEFDWGTLVSVTGYQLKDTIFDLDASYTLAEPPAQQGVASVGAY